MLYTDLHELKSILEIDPADTTEDLKLNFFIEMASNWLEEYCNRDFSYKTRTQYYQGSGTQKLLLRNRPVYPNPPAPYSPISITYDTSGLFGAAAGSFAGATTVPYVYGVDFTLQIDQDDGGCRSGIVHRINDLWTKPIVRQTGWLSPFVYTDLGSLKVTYTAGYSVDTLPPVVRTGINLLVTRMRYIFPLGMALESESYEERSIGLIEEKKDYLMALAKPWIFGLRNFKW